MIEWLLKVVRVWPNEGERGDWTSEPMTSGSVKEGDGALASPTPQFIILSSESICCLSGFWFWTSVSLIPTLFEYLDGGSLQFWLFSLEYSRLETRQNIFNQVGLMFASVNHFPLRVCWGIKWNRVWNAKSKKLCLNWATQIFSGAFGGRG